MGEEEMKRELKRLYEELDKAQGQIENIRIVLEMNKALFSAALSAASYDASRKAVGAFVGSDVLYDSLERVNEACLYIEKHPLQRPSGVMERLLFNPSPILNAARIKSAPTATEEIETFEIEWREEE